jgi:hypothetical protein
VLFRSNSTQLINVTIQSTFMNGTHFGTLNNLNSTWFIDFNEIEWSS